MDIQIKFLNQIFSLNFQKPLLYENVIEILKNKFGELDNLSILMGVVNESDFLVPLENEQDLKEFVRSHQNCDSKFEFNLNKKELDISTENFLQAQEGFFIPEDPEQIQDSIEDKNSIKSSNNHDKETEDNSFSAQTSSNNSFSSEESTNYSNEINCSMGKYIGKGSFGTVNLCTDLNTGRFYAVKHVSFDPKFAGHHSKKSVSMLQSEIEILKNLNHQRIVKYYGSQVLSNGIYIFLEYMPGGTLKDKIDSYGAFSEKNVKIYTKQILEGLEYLHSIKLIHRDVKCSNILCDLNGDLKLSDFGATIEIKQTLNKIVGNDETTKVHNSFIGTLRFMSPEVIAGKKYGRKVDIWSLGCSVIEMLTCKPPWHEIDFNHLCIKMLSNQIPEYELPVDLSSLAVEFIKLTLSFEYDKRPSSSQLLQHDFILKKDDQN